MLTCPVCAANIDIEEEDVGEGDNIGCDECGTDLKVLGKTPVDLQPADETDEEDEDELYDDEAHEDLAAGEDEEEDDEWPR
jgi:lysine biosynthesis protein LysW